MMRGRGGRVIVGEWGSCHIRICTRLSFRSHQGGIRRERRVVGIRLYLVESVGYNLVSSDHAHNDSSRGALVSARRRGVKERGGWVVLIIAKA